MGDAEEPMAGPATAAPSLRERTRRAVQRELTDAALELFLDHGYDATTIEEIAASAGLSKRSFFRYFATKEDLVLGKYALLYEEFAERLEGRPLREDVWTSLRACFQVAVEHNGSRRSIDKNVAVDRQIQASPTLHAAYLQTFDAMQQRLTEIIVARADRRGAAHAVGDPTPRALVGAAFAALMATYAAILGDDDADFEKLLDRTMRALKPAAL